MTTIQPGDFWVANIMFTDGSAAKKRPILVLWLDEQDVVAAAVTSANPRSSTDVALSDWRARVCALLQLCVCLDSIV